MPSPVMRFFLVAVTTAVLPSVTLADVPLPHSTYLEDHCVQCHDADTRKGGLDLTALGPDLTRPETFARWEQVFDRVQSGEMPPKKHTRPEAGAQAAFLTALGDRLREADRKRIAASGRVPARRLTRFEYERTVQDLLGIDIPLLHLLPEDRRADGFDTVSAAQDISHYQSSST